MHADVGDCIVIKSHRLGLHDRDYEVIEVRGPDGGPPCLIRWGDSGHVMPMGGLGDQLFELNRVAQVRCASGRSAVPGEWVRSHLDPTPADSA